MTYVRLRLSAVAARLGGLRRRWLVAFAVSIAAVAGGAAGAVQIGLAIATLPVLPAWRASAAGPAAMGAAALGYAALGAGFAMLARPWLLPQGWIESERTWPIPPSDRRRADAVVALALLAPWLALQAIGLAVSGHGVRTAVSTAAVLLVGAAGSLAAALAMQSAWRAGPTPTAATATAADTQRARVRVRVRVRRDTGARLAWPVALVLLALWRPGPTRRRSGKRLAGSALAAVAAWGLLAGPWHPGWAAAACWTVASAAVMPLRDWLVDDFAALRASARAWPIAPAHFDRSVAALAAFPAAVALAAAPAALAAATHAGRGEVRPTHAAAWMLALAATALFDALATPTDESLRALRRVFALALGAVLSAEVWT